MKIDITLEEEITEEDKPRNSIEEKQKVGSIMSRDLINEENFENNEVKWSPKDSPYINISIQKDFYQIFVDSGTAISAISVLYEEKIIKKQDNNQHYLYRVKHPQCYWRHTNTKDR